MELPLSLITVQLSYHQWHRDDDLSSILLFLLVYDDFILCVCVCVCVHVRTLRICVLVCPQNISSIVILY